MALRPPVSAQDHIYGNQKARIELLEYGDYQCPYCEMAFSIVKHIQEVFGDDLKFVFRNFPLAKIHPLATMAAIATEAAGLQGMYWEMHDLIFEHQQLLYKGAFIEYAAAINLDLEQFERDLHNETLLKKVESDFESGLRSGVNGTPTFFINGEKYLGTWEGGELGNFISRLLGSVGK